MARACSWLVFSLAAVCITASALEEVIDPEEQRLFDSLAPLLSDSPAPGDLGESVDLSQEPEPAPQVQVVQKLSAINEKLVTAKHSEVASLLDEQFTPAIWKEWNSEVVKKKLAPDTATGILNSYLCANVKDARVLVQTVEWVKENSGGAAKAAKKDADPKKDAEKKKAEKKKADPKKDAAKEKAEKKDADPKKDAAKKNADPKKDAAKEKAEKKDADPKKDAAKKNADPKKDAAKEKAEKKDADPKKDAAKKDADPKKDAAKEKAEKKDADPKKDAAKKKPATAESDDEKKLDKESKEVAAGDQEEKAAVVEAKKDKEIEKKEDATKMQEAQHEQKEEKLEKKVAQAAAQIDAEKVKGEEKVAEAVKGEQKKAAVEVKAAETKAATAEKAVETAEKEVVKAEKGAEKKMKQVEDKAEEKVEGEKVKAEKKAEKKVVEAKVEAEKEVAQAKEQEKEAEKKVEKVEKQAEEKVQTVKAQVVKKQETKINVDEAKIQKKIKKEIRKAEVAAVATVSSKAEAAPSKNVVQQIALQEKEAEAKTLSLSDMIAGEKTKVADASEILIHSTKINKFVAKSDELLHIAKMSQKQVLSEAKKQEKIAEQKAKELKQLQVKTAKAKLADYRMILENAIKDAKLMVDNEQSKLKMQEQGLHATRITIETDTARLEKLKIAIAPKQSELLKLQGATSDDTKALARAQGGLRLAEQSEIPEAVRIASERIRKIQAESKAEYDAIKQVESTVKSMEAKYQVLSVSVVARQKAEVEQSGAVDSLKNDELPKLTAETQARIRALEGNMGKKIDAILLIIGNSTPKGLQKVRTAVGKAAIQNPLEAQKAKTVAAESSAAALKQENEQLRATQQKMMGTIEGPGGMGKLEKDAAGDVAEVEKAVVNTKKIVKQAEQVKKLKGTLKGKKAELENQLSTSAPGSAKEVSTLKELEAVNADEKTMMVEGAKVEAAASKNTQAVAELASKGVIDEKKLEAAKVIEASTKVNVAQAAIAADEKKVLDAKQKISKAEQAKYSFQAKIKEIKILMKTGNGTDYSVAIKQLEGYEKQAEAITAEEDQLKSAVKVASKDIEVQKAAVAGSAAELEVVEKASAVATDKLKATEAIAKEEHSKFEGGGALAQAEAKAVTATEKAEKMSAEVEETEASSQKEVTQLKEKLAASSAAAEGVAEDTEAFVKKNDNTSGGPPAMKKKLAKDVAGVKKAIKQKKQLSNLASKAANKVSSSKAELKLAHQEGDTKKIDKARAKVDQYSKDVKKIKVAKKLVAAKQEEEEQEIKELHQVESTEDSSYHKVEGFEKGALKKWGKVHKMAEASAKQEMEQVDQIQTEVKKDKVVIASKDSEISKLKLALNMAMNPQTAQQVAKVESRETEIKNELARSKSSYEAGLKQHEETKASLSKATLNGDLHAEMVLGARDQDLKVALKRAEFHLEGLELALNKEQKATNTEEESHETIEPNTPAADVVHQVEAKAESQESRAMKIVNNGEKQSAKVEKIVVAPEEKVDTEVKVATPEGPKELAESNVSEQEQQFELLKTQLKLEQRENALLNEQKQKP